MFFCRRRFEIAPHGFVKKSNKTHVKKVKMIEFSRQKNMVY